MTKPKLTKTKVTPGGVAYTGFGAGWVDESVPDLGEILDPHGIDAAEFAAWLGPHLGMFRATSDALEGIASAADERAHLQRLQQVLGEAASALSSYSEPDLAGAQLFIEARTRGLDWGEMRDRVSRELMTMAALAEVAESTVQLPRGGRPKSASRRDALFAQVVEAVQARMPGGPTKKDVARLVAGEVMKRCGIVGLSNTKRAHRRGQK